MQEKRRFCCAMLEIRKGGSEKGFALAKHTAERGRDARTRQQGARSVASLMEIGTLL